MGERTLHQQSCRRQCIEIRQAGVPLFIISLFFYSLHISALSLPFFFNRKPSSPEPQFLKSVVFIIYPCLTNLPNMGDWGDDEVSSMNIICCHGI